MRIEALVGSSSWSKMKDAARACEALGFDAVSVPEIQGDSLVHAALVADATERRAPARSPCRRACWKTCARSLLLSLGLSAA